MSLFRGDTEAISARYNNPLMLMLKKKKTLIAAQHTDLEDRKWDDSKRQQKLETRNLNLTESAAPFIWIGASYAIPVRTNSAEHKQNQQENN